MYPKSTVSDPLLKSWRGVIFFGHIPIMVLEKLKKNGRIYAFLDEYSDKSVTPKMESVAVVVRGNEVSD